MQNCLTVDKPWFGQPWVLTMSISWPRTMHNCTFFGGKAQTHTLGP